VAVVHPSRENTRKDVIVIGLAGADPNDLDDLAIAFDGFSRRLHDSCSSIAGRVHENPWRGPRADLFRHEWDRQFWPTIHAIIAALENVQKVLRENANQQRQASGEAAKNYDHGNFFGNLFKEAEKKVDAARHDLHEIIASDEFTQALGLLQGVSTVAGVFAMVPGLEGLAVVSVAASTLVFAGHAAQMANSGKWNFGKLAEDGLGAGLGAVGGGAFGKVMKDAAELNLVKEGGRSFRTLSKAEQAFTVVRAVKVGIHDGNTTAHVVTDVAQGKYSQAAIDSMGYASGPLGLGDKDENLGGQIDALQTGLGAGSASPGGISAVLEELGQ
jgi:hypothetical protein